MQYIPYRIIRSHRKSIALIVDRKAHLIVRAPFGVSDAAIAELIDSKRSWITEKKQQAVAFDTLHQPAVLESGERLLYLGKYYTIMRSPVPQIIVSGTELLLPEQCTKQDLIYWMKSAAQNIMKERVDKYACIMNVSYTAVKISDAKTRWGSCSAKNNLNFTWRLAMCPMSVIDYIVVHELSHITHKNHGALFWNSVKTVMPDYAERQNWLRIHREIMNVL